MKIALLLLSLFCSICAQANLKLTSGSLPTSMKGLQELGFMPFSILVARALLFSGSSLVVSWYAYRRFGFLEFGICTALLYPMVGLVGQVFFNEPFKWNHILAALMISTGVIIFYFDQIWKS